MIQSKYNTFISNNNKTLCFNAISSALVELDKNRVNNDILVLEKFTESEINFLLKNNFIYNNLDSEIDMLKLLHMKSCYNSEGLSLTLLPTLDCQAKCEYCFQPIEKAYMDKNVANKIIDFIDDFYMKTSKKKLTLTWFGGEPLIDKSWKIVKYFHDTLKTKLSKDIVISSLVITNGEYMNLDKIIYLKENGLKFVQMTFDGPENIHNKVKKRHIYHKMIKNINSLIMSSA